MNDLYQGDLRLYKNFFQPVMKLVSKERIGGKLKRKYDTPKTPYQRLLDSGQISEEARKKLEEAYLSLNPAQLKRSIDAKLDELYHRYQQKRGSDQINPMKKIKPHTVTSFMIQQPRVGVTCLNDLTRLPGLPSGRPQEPSPSCALVVHSGKRPGRGFPHLPPPGRRPTHRWLALRARSGTLCDP